MDRALIVVAVGVLAGVLGACGDDDDEPPSDSLLDAVEAALCESGDDSIAVGGTVYSLEDCP